MTALIDNLKSAAVNAASWKTTSRILVIESDDWGMVRTASRDAFSRLQKAGYPVENCPYNRYDTLERSADLSALADTLSQFKDCQGRVATLTANMIVGNPDFDKIRHNKFEKYFAQPFWKTLTDYGHTSTINVYREAASGGVLKPQLHGREHTAVDEWLEALRRGDKRFHDAFDERMYTVHPGGATSGHRDLLDALRYSPTDPYFPNLAAALQVAQTWFTQFWGAPSKTFIAPCYTWHPALEKHLSDIGVAALQGTRVQRVPAKDPSNDVTRARHITGQANKYNQRYLVRNVTLEPSLAHDENQCLQQALSQTSQAFWFRTPAIVSSHRLNFIGGLDEKNRDRGLRVLSGFLSEVKRLWPDVEFMSSDELSEKIRG